MRSSISMRSVCQQAPCVQYELAMVCAIRKCRGRFERSGSNVSKALPTSDVRSTCQPALCIENHCARLVIEFHPRNAAEKNRQIQEAHEFFGSRRLLNCNDRVADGGRWPGRRCVFGARIWKFSGCLDVRLSPLDYSSLQIRGCRC